MTVPFMHAYTELLIHTCPRRGAHALGDMAAFIPSLSDQEVNELALKKYGWTKFESEAPVMMEPGARILILSRMPGQSLKSS